MFTACNGNNSIKNQNDLSVDSTDVEDTSVMAVVDTPQVAPQKDIAVKEIQRKNSKSTNHIAGSYYCRKSGDTYVLNSDYSGLFMPQNGSSCAIEWYETNSTITVTFTGEMAFLGTQILSYDKSTKSLIEKSEIYGYLKYKKQ